MSDDRPLQSEIIGQTCAGGPICLTLLCLSLAVGTGAVIGADFGVEITDSPTQSTTPVIDEEEDDEEAATDGSEALTDGVESVIPPDLRPIGLTEERALLGVWGDSPGEEED